MLLAILIPVYNERHLLSRAVDRVLCAPGPTTPEGEPLERVLILVNDGSTDGTRAIMDEMDQRDRPGSRVVCLHHERNMGKGAAIRTAIAHALSLGADVALIHDADLEYDPMDHPAVLAPILAGDADAVIGSRFIGQSHRVLYYWHSLANRFITLVSNVLTNLNLTDIECCTKAFTRDVLRAIEIRENRFGLEPEIIARLAKMRIEGEAGGTRRSLRIFEVGVRYAGRTYAEGKKITWRDGVRALWCIVRYNLFS